MSANVFEKKNTQELQKELRTKRTQLRDFRFGLAGAGARDIKEGKTLRRDIARILTELNSR